MDDAGDDQDEAVGYGRPPMGSRFRKGQSGNLRGRPKGSGQVPGLGKALSRKVTIVVDGQRQRVPVTDAVALQMTKQALSGHVPAGREIMRLAAQEADFQARLNPGGRAPLSKISVVVIDPKDCRPALEKLGVVANIGGQIKMEPWVVEAARARQPNLRLSAADELLIRNYTRQPEDKVGDPGTPIEGLGPRER